jgi:hypothetical protein
MIPYTKEETKEMDNHLKSIGILFRTILRIDKIKRLFNVDEQEK